MGISSIASCWSKAWKHIVCCRRCGPTKKEEEPPIYIDDVFFAQTHVLRPGAPFFKLVGHKDTLIKVHVLSCNCCQAAPRVEAELRLPAAAGDEEEANPADQVLRLTLQGPAILPQHFCKEPGRVVHRYDDCFTATIPKHWVQHGLQVTIFLVPKHDKNNDTDDNVLMLLDMEPYVVPKLEIGPPLVLDMTMFDIHYFAYENVDYPRGWEQEIAVRRPISEFNVQRLQHLVFEELVIPPRAGLPAVRCTCTADYQTKTGQPFNGKQAAALQWQQALQKAGGQYLLTAYYINIANVNSGGESWDYGGMGSLRSLPILNHEMGHVLGVNDLNCEGGFPYRGPMYGITKTNAGGYHAGPTWRFDPRIGFLSPILSDKAVRGNPGEWRKDPMGGGGSNEEPDEVLAGFSDYSVRKMQEYMEGHVAVWDKASQTYRKWNPYTGAYSIGVRQTGMNLPQERDVQVYSVMACTSAATPEANFIYKVLGPYRSGLIDTFDPNIEEDRQRARKLPLGRWDVSLRIVQGGVPKTFMLPVAWKPEEDDPTHASSLQTRAVNVPVRDGKVTQAVLLLTPEASVHGLPDNPQVLFSRDFT